MSSSQYIRLTEAAISAVRASHLPLYSCKYSKKTYHRRNLVETVFSVLKRTLGESLRSRKYRLQAKEIKIKIILYNLKRTLASHSIHFYRTSLIN